jgi:hypothetical protein
VERHPCGGRRVSEVLFAFAVGLVCGYVLGVVMGQV